MMGQHDRSESLFYYFRIEDQVPENHLLRFIDRYVSFDFVREKLRWAGPVGKSKTLFLVAGTP